MLYVFPIEEGLFSCECLMIIKVARYHCTHCSLRQLHFVFKGVFSCLHSSKVLTTLLRRDPRV